MFLIHGSARPIPERREDLIRAAAEITAATQDDDGCLFYEFVRSLDGEEVIGIEIWRDQSALDAHMTHEHTSVFMTQVKDALQEPPVMNRIELS